METKPTQLTPSTFKQGAKRGLYFDVTESASKLYPKLSGAELEFSESLDIAYRAICAILYNYVPLSGHPGGSISSGRIAQNLIFRTLDYDFSSPDREDADIISYAAGHKAMGLYALWALRNELVRIAEPSLLAEEKRQLRFEDLLGFRRNPTNNTPLFKQFKSKALDGHPTSATPFIKIASGASGVGLGASIGLAYGAFDIYGQNSPRVNIIEGEGGLTPGRVAEALASAATAQLHNAVIHLDWNQASIDSDQVCYENGKPGDYVQWAPAELFHLNDWNVIFVPNGHDFDQINAAQQLRAAIDNSQPTAIVYRTVKGWRYGIQGKGSHGAGHKFASEGFYSAVDEFQKHFKAELPKFCGSPTPEGIEACFWSNLAAIRKALESQKELCAEAARTISLAKERLDKLARKPRADAPELGKIYSGGYSPASVPAELRLEPGKQVTLRGALANALGYLNRETKGAILVSSADLAGSTSVGDIAKNFPRGLFNAASNPQSRLIATGGICEDGMGAIMSGVSSFGRHIGLSASYAAFIASLEHVAARLHAIGQQNHTHATGKPANAFIMVNAHAGVKTGEDGPTHADPQALQLLQENFPKGALITLTPWDPQEIWALITEALLKRPAVIAPFVTRPPETILDRKALGLPDPAESAKGVYAIASADAAKPRHGTIVLQGNGAATTFITEVLPELKKEGANLNVFYVSSADLFRLLPEHEQESIFPAALAQEAMGITDFTLPTMYYWVRSPEGLAATLHPFKKGEYLGSGQSNKVLEEAGEDAVGQLKAVREYIKAREAKSGRRS